LQKTFADGQKRLGGIGDYLGEKIAQVTGSETRVTVLGHIQRGAQPTYQDRMIASAFGVRAVDLIKEGQFGRMVAWQNRKVVDVAIDDAIATYQDVNPDDTLVHTARSLGICLGD
jgi:6-phosphofructokinase